MQQGSDSVTNKDEVVLQMDEQFKIVEDNIELYNNNITVLNKGHLDIIQATIMTLCNSLVSLDASVSGKYLVRLEDLQIKLDKLINSFKAEKKKIQDHLEKNTDRKSAINMYEKFNKK